MTDDFDDTTFRERHAVTIVAVLAVLSAACLWVTTVAPFFQQLTHEVLR